MRISFKQLKSLPAQTQSGTVLGRVRDVMIDVESHFIVQYIVGGSILHSKEFLVNREQVISIDDNKMVVQDSVSPLPIEEKKIKPLKISPEPMAARAVIDNR